MSYSVKPGNPLGRLGASIGRGLSEQVPQEIERTRLGNGLKAISANKNLTPFEKLTQLATQPGMSPQLLQSATELLKQESQGNAYRKAAGRKDGNPPQRTSDTTQQFQDKAANFDISGKGKPKSQPGQQKYGTQPEIQSDNPLNNKFLEKQPWSSERRNQEIADILDAGLTTDPSIAREIAKQNEAAELAAPSVEKANQSYLEGVEGKVRDEFTRQIEAATQKEGKELYKDIQGELMLDLEKGVRQDLATNPNANIQEVVERWRKKGLDFVKARPLLDQLAARDTWDFFFKNGETKKKLDSFQRLYANVGREEEFYNKLKTANTEKTVGFDMSPQGAAQRAFPRSEGVKKVVGKFNPKGFFKRSENSSNLASDVLKNLRPEDSLLAIIRDVRDKYPGFDQSAFFDYFRQNTDKLYPRQQRELAEGEGAMNPSWGDEWFHFRGSK